MSERDWDAASHGYQAIPAILAALLEDRALRDIAETARDALHVSFAALSFPTPQYTPASTIFVRDGLVEPLDYEPCVLTAASPHVFAMPHFPADRRRRGHCGRLRSYAGCAVLDPRQHCIGVFFVMDGRPHRLTMGEAALLRAFGRLLSSRIEIVRRFGSGPGPSMRDIIRRADQVASAGRSVEAQDLITLAYATHDIAGIRQKTPQHVPGPRGTPLR